MFSGSMEENRGVIIDDDYGGDDYEKEVENDRRRLLLVGATFYLHQMSVINSRVERIRCRTFILKGWPWIQELLGDTSRTDRCYQNLRMNRINFLNLCQLLKNEYGVSSSKNIRVEEKVAIFLYIVGQSQSSRAAQERFQRSGETIHNHFHEILNALVNMSIHNIKQEDLGGVHPHIYNNSKYHPHFQVSCTNLYFIVNIIFITFFFIFFFLSFLLFLSIASER